MVTGINHVTLAVSDLEQSFHFYTERLGLSPLARWKRGIYLAAGQDWICLSLDEDARHAPHPDYTHMAFSVSAEEFDRLRTSLLDSGVVEWKSNKSEGESFYFLDPDGHKLELHVGNLKSRLASLGETPYDGQEWFI